MAMTAASELVDAKIGASEARLGGEFRALHEQLLRHFDQGRAEMVARFDSVDARMNGMDSRMGHIEQQNRSTRSTVWSAAVFVVGSMIAMISLTASVGSWALDRGADNEKTIHAEVTQQIDARLARR